MAKRQPIGSKKLVVGTYNLYVGAVLHQPKKVTDDLDRLIGICDIIGIQEAGEGRKLLEEWARKTKGVAIYFGTGLDAHATPIIYKTKLRVVKKETIPLHGREYVGQAGAGNPTMRAKVCNVVSFMYNGRQVNFGNLHTIPSVYITIRRRLVDEEIKKTAAAVGRMRGIKIVVGDMNMTLAESKGIFAYFRRIGMKSTHETEGSMPTLKNRAIDHIFRLMDATRIRLIKVYRRKGVSDHDALIAEFWVVPSLRKRRRLRKRLRRQQRKG